jgi:Yip1 domain
MALVDRVKNILLTPQTEWAVIEEEATTPADLYREYVIPLAAIGPVAQAIGYWTFGYSVQYLGTYRMPLATALVHAVVSYLLMLVGVFVLGVAIDKLAPSFGGTPNPIQALKVAVYSFTAPWVVAIFALIPALEFVSIFGLYGLYLLYLGLPQLMKAPPDKAPGYTVVVALAAVVLFAAIRLAASSFVRMPIG